MKTLSQPTQRLLSNYQEWYRSLEPLREVSTLHVDEAASAIATFYEKIRGIVDWREEHLLRKASIERILRRRVLMGEEMDTLAEHMVLELIRGGHLPNDAIPEIKIQEVQRSIDKYLFLFQNVSAEHEKQLTELQDWLLGIAACEAEAILSPPSKERALIDYMTEVMQSRIEIKGQMSERSRKTQIFIACQQSLFKLDAPLLSYHLLQKWYPEWIKFTPSFPQLADIARDIFDIYTEIERELSHPMAQRFYSLCEKYDTAYLLLGDVLEKDPINAGGLLENPAALEAAIREAYGKRLLKSKIKVKRAAIYSTLSIFVTKVALALGLEIPIDKYLTGGFGLLALGINLSVPPLLMAILILTIRPPSRENLQRSILEVMKNVYESEQRDTYAIRQPRKRGAALSFFLFLFYALSFILSYGLIFWLLTKLNFSLLSQIIFLMFISLISFAGVKIRQRSKELVIQEERGPALFGIFELFALPIIQTGKWLSGKLARYNILIILINALIEMPLQMFLEFLEQWRFFLKEKKDEIH